MAEVIGIDYGFQTLGGTHTVGVEQRGKERKERADGIVVYVPFCEVVYVQESRKSYYNPRLHKIIADSVRRMAERSQWQQVIRLRDNEKWCSDCGDMRPLSYFSPDKNRPDGLDVWCKGCRAEHKRKMYRLEREAAGQTVRAYTRKQADVIEVDFAPAALKKTA